MKYKDSGLKWKKNLELEVPEVLKGQKVYEIQGFWIEMEKKSIRI